MSAGAADTATAAIPNRAAASQHPVAWCTAACTEKTTAADAAATAATTTAATNTAAARYQHTPAGTASTAKAA